MVQRAYLASQGLCFPRGREGLCLSVMLHLMLHETPLPSARLGADGNSTELRFSLLHFSEVHLNHGLLLGPHHVALRCPFHHVRGVHRPVKRTPACFPLLRNSSCFAFEHFPSRLKHLQPTEGVMCLTVDSFLHHQLIVVLLTATPFLDPFLKSTFITA